MSLFSSVKSKVIHVEPVIYDLVLEPFKVHILGCGSALPTLKHSASAQMIEMRGKCFMMDCGEGAQMQFRRIFMVTIALACWDFFLP